MAPIKKRTTARVKSARAARPAIVTAGLPRPDEDSPSLFVSSKKDKQKIKHSSFVSKIEKSSSKTQKRRRPNKKLVADLESLADALPGLDGEGANGEIEVGQAKVTQRNPMRSMKSKPGALKRKEKLEKLEMDRFNKNLVQLATANPGAAVQDRWAALKNHVQGNMEIKAEFVRK
ncbi:hypothetical protein IAQ61_001028 [Plenodomus lingam]|uniref:Ribosome biogenesis protein SLX9 n=1 Tax=Leptosphaeria maculans (strain JN3 / isolate v23.1.3 / race Av1-4-5-6-7-8) TaxID=985895 RepID=E5A2H8_LEPMJ|nr:hypothetical protein LEMA_P091830.1 [Plenodomus lingam JN3]KAH9880734.1 hypothetical protein IAQ61_001028 [Plenodomus lingam]CBX97774.1 hypothetical protein LEMA_P091830.1 [Plenodomus lingam JN3]